MDDLHTYVILEERSFGHYSCSFCQDNTSLVLYNSDKATWSLKTLILYGILYDDTSFTKCQINNAFIHKKAREAIKKDRKIPKAILPKNEKSLPYPNNGLNKK